ncbi:MAG: rod-binding protein [Pirellulales bacterium]|nr:rod-binding protein [Pirellulales bacterium]
MQSIQPTLAGSPWMLTQQLTQQMNQGNPRGPTDFQEALSFADSLVAKPSLKPPAWFSACQHGLGFEEQSPQEEAAAVREAFTEFIGKTVFGQMLKAMRKTVGKPAYFHGGQAEEIFRSLLDETLADEITQASADQWADPLFERQFPRHAALLKEHDKDVDTASPGLQDLIGLQRP